MTDSNATLEMKKVLRSFCHCTISLLPLKQYKIMYKLILIRYKYALELEGTDEKKTKTNREFIFEYIKCLINTINIQITELKLGVKKRTAKNEITDTIKKQLKH